MNLPQTWNSNYLLSTCRFRAGRLTGNLVPTDICCILCVVLAVIKIYFIKQAVGDEPQSNSVANIPAHKLWQLSQIWRKNWRGSDTQSLTLFFLNVIHVSWEINSCWEPLWHRAAAVGTTPAWRGRVQWAGYAPRAKASLLPSGGLACISREPQGCSVKKSSYSYHFLGPDLAKQEGWLWAWFFLQNILNLSLQTELKRKNPKEVLSDLTVLFSNTEHVYPRSRAGKLIGGVLHQDER